MTKISRQKFKTFEKEKSFQGELKNNFIFLKGVSLNQIKQFFWKVSVRL